MEFEERLRRHAALADRSRLTMVDALALGDLTPQEPGALVDAPMNLVAHHLGVLEGAGLIERHTSRGDRRRRYVTLRPERLELELPRPATTPSLVAFVCTHNSARSQYAAALWNQH